MIEVNFCLLDPPVERKGKTLFLVIEKTKSVFFHPLESLESLMMGNVIARVEKKTLTIDYKQKMRKRKNLSFEKKYW